MRSNVKLSVWINAEVFTYSDELNFPVKERDHSKKKSWFSEFKNAKLKGKRVRRHVFTCFVRCTLKNFLFICRGEIELLKCSLHIPLLNLSQSLITYWQYIGATVVVEDFVPKFRKSLSHQEFQPHPVHPNYENNTWSNTNTWLLPIQSNKNIFDTIQYLSISLQTSAAVSLYWSFSFHYFHQLFIVSRNI